MKARAKQYPGSVIRHSLADGLRLVVRWKPIAIDQGGEWYLSLWRLDGVPTDGEISGCSKAFGAPEDVGKTEQIQKGRWRGLFFVWWGATGVASLGTVVTRRCRRYPKIFNDGGFR
jgi:hypothetical protein